MRVSTIPTSAIGLVLLALAMTALAFGFALLVMPPQEAANSPSAWCFSALPALAIATSTAFNNLLRKSPRT